MEINGQERAKEAVGQRVAQMIRSGMVVGIGTGSTAAYATKAIGRRVVQENLRLSGVPTSFAAEQLARSCGIHITTLDHADRLDLAFDGADEVDPDLNLIKGRGAAHAREKVVAAVSDRFVVLVDSSKRVSVLGTRMPVPVEIIPMAAGPVMRSLKALGAEPTLRMGVRKDGPVVTDQGLWVVDAHFGGISDPAGLDAALNAIPGVLEHGLFVGITTDLLVGTSQGEVLHESA